MDNLTITKEKVLEAANKCSAAKETLQTLFPECFTEIDLKHPDRELFEKDGYDDNCFIAVRVGGEYNNKAFYLCRDLNWEIKTDSEGLKVLIPTKK